MATDQEPPKASAAAIGKRSLAIAGHRTSISLEDAFWQGLKQLAHDRDLSIAALVAEIDSGRGGTNLSSAIRVFVLTSLTQNSETCSAGSDAAEHKKDAQYF
jgi:predicted DNA-binding ribbon-helix-helix protein